ncbi:MAG: DNA replication/repair protein RecF [Steroidobacteraceae bacterium]
MTLRRVQVTDFRCLHQAEIDLDPQFTLISGPNASGKTSLLEAIYVLGRGRSFRTRRLHHLIRSGCERLMVIGEVESPARIRLGIEGSKAGMRAKIAGEWASSLAELATALPVQIIDPEVHRLIEEGPSRRRRFLDWGVFHVEPNFVAHWQNYHQALKQRNAALKARQPRTIVSAWDGDLIRYGDLLTEARLRYLGQLTIEGKGLSQALLSMELGIGYRVGWDANLTLREALDRSWASDLEFGSTQVGPQRAELTLRLDGLPVKDRISRGQQKLLAAALLIAQLKLFPRHSPVRPTLLLDDPAAELDSERLAEFIHEIRAQAVQLVVTTLHAEFSAFGIPGHRLRLDRGTVSMH